MLIPVKKNIKYYFYVFSLYSYCKWAKICYKNVIRSISYYLKKYPLKFNKDNIIGLVVLKYLDLRKRKIKRNVFLNVIDNKIEMKEVSAHLELSIQAIKQVRRYGYSLQHAIFIVYFLSDIRINNQKCISKNKIVEVKNAIKNNIFPRELVFLF